MVTAAPRKSISQCILNVQDCDPNLTTWSRPSIPGQSSAKITPVGATKPEVPDVVGFAVGFAAVVAAAVVLDGITVTVERAPSSTAQLLPGTA